MDYDLDELDVPLDEDLDGLEGLEGLDEILNDDTLTGWADGGDLEALDELHNISAEELIEGFDDLEDDEEGGEHLFSNFKEYRASKKD